MEKYNLGIDKSILNFIIKINDSYKIWLIFLNC